jgi:hypothetical protein
MASDPTMSCSSFVHLPPQDPSRQASSDSCSREAASIRRCCRLLFSNACSAHGDKLVHGQTAQAGLAVEEAAGRVMFLLDVEARVGPSRDTHLPLREFVLDLFHVNQFLDLHDLAGNRLGHGLVNCAHALLQPERSKDAASFEGETNGGAEEGDAEVGHCRCCVTGCGGWVDGGRWAIDVAGRQLMGYTAWVRDVGRVVVACCTVDPARQESSCQGSGQMTSRVALVISADSLDFLRVTHPLLLLPPPIARRPSNITHHCFATNSRVRFALRVIAHQWISATSSVQKERHHRRSQRRRRKRYVPHYYSPKTRIIRVTVWKTQQFCFSLLNT